MPFFQRLVDVFYAGVAGDDVLAPIYPEYPDFTGARHRLTARDPGGLPPTPGTAPDRTRPCGTGPRRTIGGVALEPVAGAQCDPIERLRRALGARRADRHPAVGG